MFYRPRIPGASEPVTRPFGTFLEIPPQWPPSRPIVHRGVMGDIHWYCIPFFLDRPHFRYNSIARISIAQYLNFAKFSDFPHFPNRPHLPNFAIFPDFRNTPVSKLGPFSKFYILSQTFPNSPDRPRPIYGFSEPPGISASAARNRYLRNESL